MPTAIYAHPPSQKSIAISVKLPEAAKLAVRSSGVVFEMVRPTTLARWHRTADLAESAGVDPEKVAAARRWLDELASEAGCRPRSLGDCVAGFDSDGWPIIDETGDPDAEPHELVLARRQELLDWFANPANVDRVPETREEYGKTYTGETCSVDNPRKFVRIYVAALIRLGPEHFIRDWTYKLRLPDGRRVYRCDRLPDEELLSAIRSRVVQLGR